MEFTILTELAEIVPKRCKILSNQSINQLISLVKQESSEQYTLSLSLRNKYYKKELRNDIYFNG